VTWRSWIAIVALAASACSGTSRPPPRSRLTPKQIFEKSESAIVRIEAGHAKVGTGFAVEPSGIIATNLHVVAGESEVVVELLDGRKFPVKQVLAFDMTRDLALLDLGLAKPMPFLPLGDSDAVSPGDPVVAIGNPLGVLSYTVSDGLISSVRKLGDELTVLQISAPISQGSSGGPLFNQFGEVIGVTSAIIPSGQNINFAIPSNYVKSMVVRSEQLSMQEFASKTKEFAEREARDDGPRISRAVPTHELSIFSGCSPEQIADMALAIEQAIKVGAPLYNKGEIEACFRIYEGTAVKFERDSRCRGISTAFKDGLARAAKLDTYKEKAWAMRDTFDGLLNVAERWVQANGKRLPAP